MLSTLDRGLYRLERALVVASLAAMALMVTLDVVYRKLVADYALIHSIVIGIVAYALLVFAARTARLRMAPAVGLVLLAAAFGLSRLMLHAESCWTYVALYGFGAGGVATAMTPKARMALAAVSAVVVLSLFAFVPEGFSWAKEVSLVLLLWVGFLGASMASYDRRHITIDFVRKLIPEGARNRYELVSNLVSAGFSAFLMLLAYRYVFAEGFGIYHLGGEYDHSGIPTWCGVAAVPTGLGIMTLRFLGHAINAARGRYEAPEAKLA